MKSGRSYIIKVGIIFICIVAFGNTGDWGNFSSFNLQAKANLNDFKIEVAAEFNVSMAVVEDLIKNVKMEPADVYFTLKLREITKKDINVIVSEYKKNKEKGWGNIAKELGIKPGSKEFHELKSKADMMKEGKSPLEKKKKDMKSMDNKKKK